LKIKINIELGVVNFERISTLPNISRLKMSETSYFMSSWIY